MANYWTNRGMMLVAFAICFSSLLQFANGKPHFNVKGKVFCDTCRVHFITEASFYLPGAKVRLECSNRETNATTFSGEAVTDKAGKYQIKVPGEHDGELCQFTPISSPDPQCNELSSDPFMKKANQIILSHHNGITSNTRTANPIGFFSNEALPQCTEILRKIIVTATGIVP